MRVVFGFPAFWRLLGHGTGIIICLLGIAVFISNRLSFNETCVLQIGLAGKQPYKPIGPPKPGNCCSRGNDCCQSAYYVGKIETRFLRLSGIQDVCLACVFSLINILIDHRSAD